MIFGSKESNHSEVKNKLVALNKRLYNAMITNFLTYKEILTTNKANIVRKLSPIPMNRGQLAINKKLVKQYGDEFSENNTRQI